MSSAARAAAVFALVVSLVGGPAVVAAAAPPATSWPDTVTVSGAYGLDFDAAGTTLYVAQRETGISKVAPDGTVTRLVTSTDSFMAIAVEASGDLLVTVDSDRNIYRISAADLAARPADYLVNGFWRTRATVVYTDPTRTFLYGLEVAADGTIYYSTFVDRQITVLRGGVTTPLFAPGVQLPSYATAFDLHSDGSLVIAADNARLYGISATAMSAGSVPAAAIQQLDMPFISAYGLAFFDDNRTFYAGAIGKRQLTTIPITDAEPTITGIAQVGQTLTAVEGAWTPGAAFTYQWVRDGVDIAGATARTYTAVAADRDAALAVRVSGTAPAYSGATRTSPAVSVRAAGSVPTTPEQPRPALAATGSTPAFGVVAVALAVLVMGVLAVATPRHRRG